MRSADERGPFGGPVCRWCNGPMLTDGKQTCRVAVMTTETQRRVFIRGEAWIAGEHNVDPDDGFWAKGVGANIEVEKPEPGEVSIQILVGRDEDRTADASFYMSNQEALRLMAALGQAVLVDDSA